MSELNELPEGWVVSSLGEVSTKPQYGWTTKASSEGDNLKLLRTSDITSGRVNWETVPTCVVEPEEPSKYFLDAGDIVVARAGSVGKSILLKESVRDAVFASYLVRLTPAISSQFVDFFMHSRLYWEQIEDKSSGIAVPNVNASKLAQINLPVAPLNEQRRIVEKIETLFARLDKGEEAIRETQKLLTRYRQSVLKAAVTGEFIGSNQASWSSTTLGTLLTDIRYGTAKKCSYQQANTAILRIPNVGSGWVDLSDLKFTDLDAKEKEKLSLISGDILIVRSNGSANLVARGAIVTDAAEGMAFAGYLIRLRIDQTKLLPNYLHMVLEAPQTRMPIERNARSTSGVHNINSTEVKAIPIQLPPIEEQILIMEEVEAAFIKIERLEQWCETKLKRSAALRQSILKDAFSGKLVEQDPKDEPASALLARITAEKAQLKAKAKAKPARRKKKAS